ncbi:MAG TPA: ATP-binding protein [Candidatus Sulfotelmatobacter sp.]|nr:ATP-binding protein [Candidatus Sulfotelmatobacter sp.]
MTTSMQTRERVVAAEPVFLRRTRLRAQRRALWLRALWSLDANEKGFAITHNEVDRILNDPAETAEQEAKFYEENREARELTRLIAEADDSAQLDARWYRLQRVFELTAQEGDLLALAASVAADPAFARVCGYLHDDVSACYATPLLAAALFGWRQPMGADSALARWRLAEVPQNAGNPGAPNASWIADPYIVQWLRGGPAMDPAAAAAVDVISAAQVAQLDNLDPNTHSAIGNFIAEVPPPVEIELTAPNGTGKRTIAAQVCAETGLDLMVIDTQILTAVETSAPTHERILRVVRAARLEGAILYWNHAGLLDTRARQIIAGACDLMFFGSEAPTKPLPTTRASRGSFAMRPIGQASRLRLWRQFTDEPFPEAMRGWSLRPAEIRAAAQIARAGADAVLDACRRMLYSEPGELFTALPCPYGWDDIVLAPGIRKQLEELTAQARLGAAVLEEWGFERLCRMGRGLNVLFAGPSGTGKTMAAQVVARVLGRELYRVDLAGVVNKYIGETEKRLKQVFEACERSAVVLFFDEADALFGQRTQVKDAHDRYANIQIDYLLQRMEQFDGVAILATNRKNDLDPAFLRRLRFIVDFLAPGPQERLALWRLSLAGRSPSGEELLDGIAWQWLADNLVLTGADIKAITLAAAFLARAEGSRIRMEHLLHAARREMNKHGAAWRASEWSSKSLA